MGLEITIPILVGFALIFWMRKRVKAAENRNAASSVFKTMTLFKLGYDGEKDSKKIEELLGLSDADFFAHIREEYGRKSKLFRSHVLRFIRSSVATPPGTPPEERERVLTAVDRLLGDPRTTLHLLLYPNELPAFLLLRDAKLQTGENREICDCREAVSLRLALPLELEEKIKSFARLQEDIGRFPSESP